MQRSASQTSCGTLTRWNRPFVHLPGIPRGGGKGKGDTRTSALPRPDPNFSGCWHCGKSHAGGRRQCHEFEALLKANSAKLPADYEGAYEKYLKSKNAFVNLFHAQSDAHFVVENPEPSGPRPTQPAKVACALVAQQEEHPEPSNQHQFFAFCHAHAGPELEATPTANTFQAFVQADEDGEHDVEDIAAAFQQLTSHVQIGPRPSQKAARASRTPKPLSRKQIMQIARGIKSGKIQQADLDLQTNADYDAVRALVGSGSSVHVVNAQKVFPKARVIPPRQGAAGFKTANGGVVADLGTVEPPLRYRRATRQNHSLCKC